MSMVLSYSARSIMASSLRTRREKLPVDKIVFSPIGYIRSPYKEPGQAPPQSVMREDVYAQIEVLPQYREALDDLRGGMYIVVLFHFHLSRGYTLKTRTPWSDEPRGLFSARTPHRPNPIGMSIVRLVSIEGTTLTIEGVDMVDGTPVLDIKVWAPSLAPQRAWEA